MSQNEVFAEAALRQPWYTDKVTAETENNLKKTCALKYPSIKQLAGGGAKRAERGSCPTWQFPASEKL